MPVTCRSHAQIYLHIHNGLGGSLTQKITYGGLEATPTYGGLESERCEAYPKQVDGGRPEETGSKACCINDSTRREPLMAE